MQNEPLEKTLVVKGAPRLIDGAIGERQGTLMVLVGTDVGATFALASSSSIIGRSPQVEVALEDDGISRNHARIFHCKDHYELEDLGSSNGTFLGNTRVEGRVRLNDGARLQIGNTLLRFALQDKIERDACKRIYEMSVRDGLTGVFNRRYFEDRLTAEFGFAARHGSALCVLLADIDHFKRINDAFGNQAGDMVLRRVAAELRAGTRTEDVMSRYRGEEFAILARGIDVIGARMFAERVRSMAERARIEWDGKIIPVTISIGFAHNHSGAALNKAQRLVGAADQALYAAKQAGRNRVEQAASPSRYSAVNTDSATPSSTPSVIAAPPKMKRRIWDQATAPAEPRHKGGHASRPERGPSRSRKNQPNPRDPR